MASISKLTINKIKYDIADSALPSAETGSTGDVLTVSEEKAWEAAAPSGGGTGVLVVHNPEGTLDKTWQEIADAALAVIITPVGSDGDGAVQKEIVMFTRESDFSVVSQGATADENPVFSSYSADSADDYPVFD